MFSLSDILKKYKEEKERQEGPPSVQEEASIIPATVGADAEPLYFPVLRFVRHLRLEKYNPLSVKCFLLNSSCARAYFIFFPYSATMKMVVLASVFTQLC